MHIVTHRNPDGYRVSVPLAHGDLATHLAWSRRVALGHLQLFRAAAAAHDACNRQDLAETIAVASALADMLTRRDFEKPEAAPPESYASVLGAFNASLLAHG